MRQFELDDVFRFSSMLEQTGLTGTVQSIFNRAAEVRCKRKPTVAPDVMGAQMRTLVAEEASDSEIGAEAIRLCQDRAASDTDLYALGIDSCLSIFKVAAKKNVSSSIYAFFAPIWDMKEEDIGHMKISEVKAKFREMLEVNDAKDFFELFRGLIG